MSANGAAELSDRYARNCAAAVEAADVEREGAGRRVGRSGHDESAPDARHVDAAASTRRTPSACRRDQDSVRASLLYVDAAVTPPISEKFEIALPPLALWS